MTGTSTTNAAGTGVGPEQGGRSASRLIGATVSEHWIIVVLAALVVGFSIVSPSFRTVFNFKNILDDASLLLVMGVGETYVMISGGIDLSIGSVLVFAGVVAGKVMGLGAGLGIPSPASGPVIVIALIVGVLSGGAWGALNGALVAFAKIPPLIVTLGTLGMAFGLAQIITGGDDLSGVPARLTNDIGLGTVVGIPVLVIVAAIAAIIGGVFLAWSRFGTYTYAIGSNPEAARRVAIPINRHIMKVYVLCGLLAGVAGILSLTHFTTTTIDSHGQDELAVIAGVVLGGTSLFGGYGSILKTVVGILIPAVLASGLVIINVQPFWQTVVTGAVLILAVYFDQLKRKTRARGT
jgi:ribose transport system permease protein